MIYIEGKLTLEEHLKHLKELYPLYLFERNMSDFIQMILEDMDIPSLDKVRSCINLCQHVKANK